VFTDLDLALGAIFATHASLALVNATPQANAEHLQLALDSNRQIGIAIGILTAQQRCTPDQAFDQLRTLASICIANCATSPSTSHSPGSCPIIPDRDTRSRGLCRRLVGHGDHPPRSGRPVRCGGAASSSASWRDDARPGMPSGASRSQASRRARRDAQQHRAW
jgi:ANTAR domain-containing protein